MQIFADCAQDYSNLGLRVFPTGGDEGKTPLIRGWNKVGKNALSELIKKFPDSNIGIIDGTDGGITRVDIDDPQLIDDCIQEFGDTPIKVGTPSGGYHLWYRANQEKRIISYQGEAIDILGRGGMGIAPPSINPKKGTYQFIQGTLEDIPKLPRIKRITTTKLQKDMCTGDGRNVALFDYARSIALNYQYKESLYEKLFDHNSEFKDPINANEVQKVADSVWNYKQQNRLFIPGCEASSVIPRNEYERLLNSPQALSLLIKLRLEHGWRNGGRFALTAATAKTINVSYETFKKARQKLIDEDLIKVINPGRKHVRKPTIVRLAV